MNIPRLTLIGAGPGDEELITLKGIKAIEQADVILYDALANESLLKYTRPNTPVIFVGKRAGFSAFTQEEINTLIIENAYRYGHVVRLKGGDPLVFGRAVEEMEAVRAEGIACKIVSGVSSSIAVPAAIGIPVTARGVAESFWVLTGTTRTGELSKDIQLAAQSSATIVILMGMNKLEEICEIFESFGKAHTPAAIIQHGTTAKQRHVLGDVSNIAEQAQKKNLGNPAVIVIGEVVSLCPEYVFSVGQVCNLSL